jgi:hypothetical protein
MDHNSSGAAIRGSVNVSRQLLALALLVTSTLSWQNTAAATDQGNYLLSLSASRPPCLDSATAADEVFGIRCYGTRTTETSVEMPADRIVYLDRGAEVPAEWLFVGPLLLRADDLPEPGLGYRIRRSDAGLRLEILAGSRMRSTAIGLNTWTPALTPEDRTVWVRLSSVD